ncbi:cupin domain-containing protein [Deinococcus sp.]|uniref:cupin domain-containing protein n=1 Tax=Deinococcus sp. TaxID=47478 RepID=UPI003B5A912A
MTRAGDIHHNPVTGERAVIRVGARDSGGQELRADLYVQPGGAVVGEHLHPGLEETFTLLSGQLGLRLNGHDLTPQIGQRVVIPAGVAHDWWNAGPEEAHVLVEVRPAARFEAMILNMFGLARDGKTDAKGLPRPLQLAVTAQEFSDVIVFTRPPRWLQRIIFGVLAPLGRRLGYQGNNPKYVGRSETDDTGRPFPIIHMAQPDTAPPPDSR